MSQGRAAAFLGQASYNMDAAMVTEISYFKASCESTTEDLTTLQSRFKIWSVKIKKS